jgi:hypothetical protein
MGAKSNDRVIFAPRGGGAEKDASRDRWYRSIQSVEQQAVSNVFRIDEVASCQ